MILQTQRNTYFMLLEQKGQRNTTMLFMKSSIN